MRSRGSADEAGASAVEYGLLITGVAAVVAIAVLALGGPVDEMFTDTCDQLDSQSTVATSCD